MHRNIVDIIEVVFLRGGADVTIVVPITLEDTIHSCKQDITTNVEFTFVD